MKVECKGCLKMKTRNYAEKVQGGRRFYTSPDGRFWSGRYCPDCHNKRRMDAYRNSRSPATDHSARMVVFAPGAKIRDCQSCGLKTPNYYNCNPCHSSIVESAGGDDTYLYQFHGGR